MRLFMPSKKKRTPAKKKPVKTKKRACEDSTQRRHPARAGAPFGRPAK